MSELDAHDQYIPSYGTSPAFAASISRSPCRTQGRSNLHGHPFLQENTLWASKEEVTLAFSPSNRCPGNSVITQLMTNVSKVFCRSYLEAVAFWADRISAQKVDLIQREDKLGIVVATHLGGKWSVACCPESILDFSVVCEHHK